MKNKRLHRVFGLLLSAVMLFGLLTGCAAHDHGDSPAAETVAAEKEEQGMSEQNAAAQNTQAPAPKENELPSFLEFAAGSGFAVTQYDVHDDYYMINYTAEDADVMSVAQDFIRAMVSDAGFEVITYTTKDHSDWHYESWMLDHPCDLTMQQLDVVNFYDEVADVEMIINQYQDWDECTFAIRFVKGLETADSKNAPSGGGGGGGSLFGEDCTWCGGDGRCNECGGDGRVSNWLAGTTKYVDQNCTNCNAGRCRQCGGSGKK